MDFFDVMRAGRGEAAMSVPEQWGQGRAVFGGVAVALVYQAMRAQVPAARPLRSLAVTFVAPMVCAKEVRFEVEVLREGRAVSQVLGRAVQDGQVVTLVQGSFGSGRTSTVTVEAEPAPPIKAVENCQELPYLRGVTPEFTRHLAMRWGQGGLPFSNTAAREMGGWVRLRGEVPDVAVDESLVLALVDAWPPALLSYLRSPAPGSSLTWTIEFVQPQPLISSRDWCRYQARIEHARDGYGHIAAGLWSPAGELLALSRQTVVVFD
jgi:acyl-CoA thioesterase